MMARPSSQRLDEEVAAHADLVTGLAVCAMPLGFDWDR